MIEGFRKVNFRSEALALVAECNDIIRDYAGQGLRLTLRQLYYQLVSKNRIENTERSYKRLGNIVSDARLSGRMDWSAIEDRNREPITVSDWSGLDTLVDSALSAYRLPRWEGQEHYVELWVEKAALAGVLEPLAREFHVTLMVNRGYSSQSAMYESASRFKERCGSTEDEAAWTDDDGDVTQPATYTHERTPVLFYLGDHDPSGEDMVRDVRERMEMFGVTGIDVRKLALTKAQITQYRPPPNPAKVTDPRARDYIARHGNTSWEVDALNPGILARLVRTAFASVIDVEKMARIKEQEQIDKQQLKEAVAELLKRRQDSGDDE
jgi:hypothetical protein